MVLPWLAKKLRIERLGAVVAILVTAVMLIVFWFDPLARFEDASLDIRFLLRGPRPAGEEVKLVLIDEPSIRELGRWPWSRDKQAQLVTAIADDGAKVIGIDVIFSEPEVTEYLHALREVRDAADAEAASPRLRNLLARRIDAADTDSQFAHALARAGNVVLALPLLIPEDSSRQYTPQFVQAPSYIKKAEFMLIRDSRNGEDLAPYRAIDSVPPLKAFADSAISLGHVFTVPERDGVTRYEYLALRYGSGQDYFPSLGLEVARLYLGVPRDRMSVTLGDGVRLGQIFIPLDQKARMLIDYAGREQSIPHISATDVWHKRFPPGSFKGKAVLIGTSALGTYDQKATPFSANFPGVEKNATVAENILHQRFVMKSIWMGPLDFGLILLAGLGLGTTVMRMRALQAAALSLTLILGYIVAVQILFLTYGIWIGVVYPVLTALLVFVTVTVLKFMTEEKQAKEVRTMFSSYVSPRIVNELIKDPKKARLGGQRKELTMLFSDIVGFTSFSEQRTAEEVVAQLNEYLGAMAEVVFRWNGTLDKFVGDAIVVFWGAPLDQPDHAELAVKCALHMRRRLEELHKKWLAEGKYPLDMGIGINSGEVLVGNMGAEGRKMDYTMIGDQVNLASRVEGLTRKFKAPIVITEHTLKHIQPLLAAEDTEANKGRLGPLLIRGFGVVLVKGREKHVLAYAVESLSLDEPSRIEEAPASSLEV